ncbi:hypothetical protein K1T71_002013 [Dendrolimus kikuchii]|uniref:Uncharacterized protein n=1 Tax=Dendrolimus kikuchii TaxID=765133 RepID=A0ACC1DF93_9NEOP|nr:hypothetical protein K1T71_002013 [Dendrolimus kikuchii]
MIRSYRCDDRSRSDDHSRANLCGHGSGTAAVECRVCVGILRYTKPFTPVYTYADRERPIEESHPRPTIDEEHVEATVNVINSTNKNNCINTEDPDYIPEINDDDSEQP